MQLSEVFGDENTHRCREAPFEAAIYNLKAKGEKFEKFKSNSKIEMTVEAEMTASKQEKKKECSTLELPVDFSKDDVTRVQDFILVVLIIPVQDACLGIFWLI